MIKISDRLTTVAAMIPEGGILADVGTDHGYIPIRLLQEGKIEAALAMDVNEGPLARAKEHAEENGLTDKITLRLSDGLEKLEAGEADTLLIAGMGGKLMARILRDGEDVFKSMKTAVLQPQSDLDEVRGFVLSHGFTIIDETMLIEDGKYYTIMKAVKGESEAYTKADLVFGKINIEKRSPVLRSLIERDQRIYGDIAKKLSYDQEKHKERLEELGAYQALLNEVMTRMA